MGTRNSKHKNYSSLSSSLYRTFPATNPASTREGKTREKTSTIVSIEGSFVANDYLLEAKGNTDYRRFAKKVAEKLRKEQEQIMLLAFSGIQSQRVGIETSSSSRSSSIPNSIMLYSRDPSRAGHVALPCIILLTTDSTKLTLDSVKSSDMLSA